MDPDFFDTLVEGRGKRLLSLIPANIKTRTGSISGGFIPNQKVKNGHNSSQQDENRAHEIVHCSSTTGNKQTMIKVITENGNQQTSSKNLLEQQPLSNIDLNTGNIVFCKSIIDGVEDHNNQEKQYFTDLQDQEAVTNIDINIENVNSCMNMIDGDNYIEEQISFTDLQDQQPVTNIDINIENVNSCMNMIDGDEDNYIEVQTSFTDLQYQQPVTNIDINIENVNSCMNMIDGNEGNYNEEQTSFTDLQELQPLTNINLDMENLDSCMIIIDQDEELKNQDSNDKDYVPNSSSSDSEHNDNEELKNQNSNDKDYVPNSSSSDTDSQLSYEEDRTSTGSIVEQNINRAVEGELSDLEVEEATEKRSSRKRVRNESMWAKNLKKTKLNKGESYVTKSGRLVGEKTLKPGCGDKCRLNCSKKIDPVVRQKLLDDFLNLTDVNRKRDFISKLIEEVHPKYSYKKHNSLRSINYSFHFIVDGERFKVCKKMFVDTFVISATYLTTVKKKTTSTGTVTEDLRGRHKNQPKVNNSIISGIHDHINSFARIESHYCRADTKREFIDGDLSLSEMYRLYKSSCINNGVQFSKKHKYEEIFNTKFNIGFFVPKKDQCSLCACFQNNSEEEKLKIQNEMNIHLREKELSREEKKQDKEKSRDPNSKTLVACFDLQAVFQLPRGQISTFYYKRKLNALNFTIFDATANQGYCYVWHEGSAKRGALEIASFLFDFLKENVSGCGKKVIFYSDNCSGQNKNHTLLTMYLNAVQTLDVNSITHKYLIVGHTQNEGDTMHSAIERQLKRATNKTPLYVPSQLVAIVQMANKEKKQFQVKEMDTSDIYDWAAVENSFPGRNFQYSTTGEKVTWANVKMFEVRKSAPLTVFYKYSYEQQEMMSFNLDDKITKKKDGSVGIVSRGSSSSSTARAASSKTRRAKKNLESAPAVENIHQLRPAYRVPPGISHQKKADLLSLCASKLIPTPYHNFFQGLTTKDNE